MARLTCWRAARSRRRCAWCRRCSRRGRCDCVNTSAHGLLERVAALQSAQEAEQHAERKAQQWREQGARRGGIQLHGARRARGNVHVHRMRSCRALDRQPLLEKHHCCSAQSDAAIAIACCNEARCGLGLEQRARRGVVFVAWRIGRCMRALCPRAASVALGGVLLSATGEKDAILLSRVGAFVALGGRKDFRKP